MEVEDGQGGVGGYGGNIGGQRRQREERVEAERVSSGHIERRLDLSGGKAQWH